MEYVSLEKYFKLIIKRWKIILYFTLAFIGLGILYGIFVYNPRYTTSAKILLKQDDINSYVTQLNSESVVSTMPGQNKNPILTQIEILNSHNIALKVAEKLSNDAIFQGYPPSVAASIIQRSIRLNNPIGTDIIDVSVSWNNPANAQKVASALLDSYYDYNESLYKKSISNTKKYIEDQLKETNQKLLKVREDIEKYRKENSSINVDLEAESVISQIERIENYLSDINVNISASDKKVNELSKNLEVDLKKAIEAVALGQSSSLVGLNEKLAGDQQRLASLKIKYPENTPQIKTLESEIKEIKSQIESETISLIGKKSLKGSNSIISDNVRSEMVNEYVKNSIELNSMLAQKSTLRKILDNLKVNQKTIPEVQKNLTMLQEKEKTLSLIVETLNTKLVEAQIKESAITSNVSIVEEPTLPRGEAFPTFSYILILFVVTGFLMGVATVLGLYYVEDICEGTNELEEIIKAPVFGIIPWLTSNAYDNFLTDYNPHSVVAIIYQKIATTLKVKCLKKKINSIGIISAELEKRRSIVAASLANTFAKIEDSVILLDTDFRDSSLTREFDIDFSQYPDITDCVIELEKNNNNPEICKQIISKYIVSVPDQKNLYIIPNNNKVINPYEILNNETLTKLIQLLKAEFDLVIVDMPPMLAVADSVITAQHLDGLVVLCGVKTARSKLRRIKKICDENYVEILGTIARDTLSELEVPENQYIRQLSGKEA